MKSVGVLAAIIGDKWAPASNLTSDAENQIERIGAEVRYRYDFRYTPCIKPFNSGPRLNFFKRAHPTCL